MNYDEKKYPMIWKRVMRTGYCFTARIPCRVIRRAGKKLEIAASLIGGAERIHRVEPKSLIHDPCECFAGCKALEKFGYKQEFNERCEWVDTAEAKP